MKRLTEAQLKQQCGLRCRSCGEEHTCRIRNTSNAQFEQDKAFHDREVERLVGLEQVHHRNELERIFNELERVIGFSVNKNDTPDTWDELQEFKKRELEK